METQEKSKETAVKSQAPQAANMVKLSEVCFSTLRRWPWILISIAVCMGLAVYYLLRTPPTYTRTASIVIKDDSKGSSGISEAGAFSDMGLLQANSNISDEINKIMSPDVMTEVVKRLDLNVSCYKPGKFHNELIYGSQLPVNVKFPSALENTSASATVKLLPGEKYVVEDLECNGEDAVYDESKALRLGDTLRTSAGTVVVEKTPYYAQTKCDEILVQRIPLKGAVGKFSGELNVALKSDKGNTINITATDQSTQRAEDLIDAVIVIYNEKWMENRNQISVSTSNFINERLGVIESELGNVDQDISSYQSAHLIPDVQQAASMYMNESHAASSAMLELNNQLQMTRYMRGYLANEANRTQVLPVNSGIQNSTIESQIGEYNAKMLQRNQYATNSSETHPVVMDLDAQLAGMRTAIIATIDNQIVALNTQIRNLQTSQSHATAQIAANPTQAKYLLSVERQQKVKESLYLYLLQKREENELSQAFTAYNTQVITKPTGSNAPTAPDARRILLIAFVAGICIPFGISYIMAMMNTKVRGRKDVEALSVPFLGEIPAFNGKKRSKKLLGKDDKNEQPSVVVRQGKRDVVNEAFRVLRTNVGFMSAKENGCSVIMVTSFNPGSGKTFISLNLGISLALKGKKVLVIDGDMRRGSTSECVGSPKVGISNYLVGEIDSIAGVKVDDSIAENMSVLPVGTIPPNPTELLETERFVELIRDLREQYDYILIDCPPVEMMADAQIINQVSDRTIFVVRTGLLDRSMLPELEKLMEEKKFKNIGLVLNATPVEGSRYGAKYGYGYGYGNYGHYVKND